MDFALSDEQRMLVDLARRFVEEELYPHESEVERLNEVPPELQREIRANAMELGIYAANMPEELGGGFKLKALDYVFHGLPLAILDDSAAGLPLDAGADEAGDVGQHQVRARQDAE